MTAEQISTLSDSRLALKQRESAISPWSFFSDAAEVASQLQPELPVMCFSPARLTASAKRFIAGFPGEVAYAVKANSSIDALMAIAAAGVRVFDVASLVEMKTVRAVCPQAEFHYHNPIKSRHEIEQAYHAYKCTRFAADHPFEIKKIAEVLEGAEGIEIAIRFRLPAHGRSAHDFSTKFGATPAEAAELLRAADAQGYATVLTFHPRFPVFRSWCLAPAHPRRSRNC